MASQLDGFLKRWTGTILVAALLTILIPLAARAQCVTNLGDSSVPGSGSLRSCIQPGATVTFAASLNGGTITVLTPLSIPGAIIMGPGPNLLTISGGNNVQVFDVTSGPTVISGLTIANGNNGTGNGGAINNNSSLAVSNCTFSDNKAGLGGAIYSSTAGSLTVSNSTFSGNIATGFGGGIFINAGGLTVNNSTFSGNTASIGGGGIYNDGSTWTVNNSTFSGNKASLGGGIFNSGALTLNNSIVAGNTPATDDCDACGTQSSYNLIGGNPQLAPLGWYGGSTQTMIPLPGSTVIGAGLASASDDPNMDQRGFARLSATGKAVDLGAVQTDFLIVTTNTDQVDGTPDCASGTGSTCSLRDTLTLAASNGSADIAFASTVTGTINLGTGTNTPLPSISGNLDLFGPGANNLTVSGGKSSSVGTIFAMNSGANAAISGITIANGNSGEGGGIFKDGTLTVNNSSFSGNTAGDGGGVFNDSGPLIVTNSTFSGSTADGDGGGIFLNEGTLIVANSTFSGNGASGDGGGIFSESTLTVNNSTFSGNTASGEGGGIYHSAGTLTLTNSVVAGNTTDGVLGSDDCDSCGAQSTYNLIGGTPQLAPLGSYGGATQTMLPLPGSPAICAGSATLDPGILTDQRGFARLNTTYTGYIPPAAPCLDLGADQTNYQSIQFAQAAYSGSTGAYISTPAAPVVSVTENGNNIGAVPVTLSFSGTAPSSVSGTGPVTTVAGTGATFPSLTVSPEGDYTLQASLAITSSVTISNTATLDVDTLATVQSVTTTSASGTYTTTAAIYITVNFSKLVNVTGTPTLGLNSGGTAYYSSGTGSAALVFKYTVAAPQSSADLDVASASALSGTIQDSSSVAATLTLPTGNGPGALGAAGIVINTTQYTLTLVANPSADGTVAANPTTTPNVTPALSNGTYLSGTQVTLTPTPSSNLYKFSNWTGTKSSSSNPLILTMNKSYSETANFVANTVTVTIETSPPGLKFSVDGTTYTSTQTPSWKVGSKHTIATTTPQTMSATPRTLYNFPIWSDGGANSHTVTAAPGTTNYTVTFNVYYELTVAASPAAGGTVTPALGGYFLAESVVGLEAFPNSGYTFKSWTGNVASTTNKTTTITMTAPETVTANFAKSK